MSPPRVLVGVIGPSAAAELDRRNAEMLGRLIGDRGWVLLSGGRDAGVMASANAGARSAGGLTVGLLPDESGNASPDVEIVIRTGLGSARNNIIALSADVLVACGTGAGTSSEVALGIKAGKPVILLGSSETTWAFFKELGGDLVTRVESPEDAVARIEAILS